LLDIIIEPDLEPLRIRTGSNTESGHRLLRRNERGESLRPPTHSHGLGAGTVGPWIALAFLASACSIPPVSAPATPSPPPSPTLTPAAIPSATATAAATPTPSATPDPYWEYTIEYLRSRSYGGGELAVDEKTGTNSAFTRYLVHHPSDGLTIHGFMDVPNSDGPHPVIVALHGYIDPAIYQTFDYTTHYADALASAGYLVLHPNLRGYAPSDGGDDLFRVGMAVDVLNLIEIVRSSGGEPGPLEAADPARMGLWGHSMGGGIVTRVITVDAGIKAAVLYAPMSGDEVKNYEAIGDWSDQQRGIVERAAPQAELQLISPVYFFNRIQAAVSIHHGLHDPLVPVQWSMQTCQQLKALGRIVECHYYPGMPHTFEGQADKEFMEYARQFFDRYLSEP
jgi:dienelactone hydrolase